jgi:hypothetical protein
MFKFVRWKYKEWALEEVHEVMHDKINNKEFRKISLNLFDYFSNFATLT